MTAILALESLKDQRAVGPLCGVLRTDSRPDVRAAAATALGALGDRRAAEALTAALDDKGEIVETKYVRNWALEGEPEEPVDHVAYTVASSARWALTRLGVEQG